MQLKVIHHQLVLSLVSIALQNVNQYEVHVMYTINLLYILDIK